MREDLLDIVFALQDSLGHTQKVLGLDPEDNRVIICD